jgi:CRP-like cAMP-binding protein
MIGILVERVQRLTEQLVDAAFTNTAAAVVRTISRILPAFPSAADGTVEIRLRQQDLAALAMTTRPTVNRALQDLRDDGVIELFRGGLRVVDTDAIHRLAS